MKKIISLIIVAVLVISLACLVACGGKDSDNKVSDALTTTAPLITTDRDVTDELTTDEDESMTGNVEDNTNGVIESSESDTSNDSTTTTKK